MSNTLLILSVLIGATIALFVQPGKKSLQLLLSFSGAYLLSMTVLHLLPEVFETQQQNIGLFILLGIIVQTVLEYFSKGAEHGHVHIHQDLKHIPWMLLISLNIHAFLEGMPLGSGHNPELLWAILIHKIPVAIILILFLKQSGLAKWMVGLFILIFAIASPMGSIFTKEIDFLQDYFVEITAIIIGIFLHISTAILFESSQNHKFNLQKFIAILIGFGIALLGVHQ